jgi:uncharacterized membrane protein
MSAVPETSQTESLPQTALPPSEPVYNAQAAATVAWTRTVAVAALLGLIALGLAWELWLAPVRPGGSWLAIKVLPLCIPLAGLLKHRMYTYRWLSLLVWVYFTEGVVRAWSDKFPGNVLAGVEIALCLVLFVACAAHVRLRFLQAKKASLA